MKELIIAIGPTGAGQEGYFKNNYSSAPIVTIVTLSKSLFNTFSSLYSLLEKAEPTIIVNDFHINAKARSSYQTMAEKYDYHLKFLWFTTISAVCEKEIILNEKNENLKREKLKNNHRYFKEFEQPSVDECDELLQIEEANYAELQDLSDLKGKILIIGDVHGMYNEAISLINEHSPDYTVFLGDLNDRGPDFLKIYSFIRSHPSSVFSVKGNHEQKLLNFLFSSKDPKSETLKNTLKEINAQLSLEDKKHMQKWILKLPHIIKLPLNFVAAHAGFNLYRPLSQQLFLDTLFIKRIGLEMWYQKEQSEEYKKLNLVFGHEVHKEAKVKDNIYALDGGAVYGGNIRGLLMDTEEKSWKLVEKKSPAFYPKDEITELLK